MTFLPRISVLPRIALAAIGALAALAIFSSAAHACSYPDAEKIFAAQEDENLYTLAPDGGFENGAEGWHLEGGAEVVEGNESYFLNSSEDDAALSVPGDAATATSPLFCVDETTPSFKLVALNDAKSTSKLRVTVTYSGEKQIHQSDIKLDPKNWEASKDLKINTEKGKGERAAQITITPIDDKGEWLVDDVYIDPWARR